MKANPIRAKGRSILQATRSYFGVNEIQIMQSSRPYCALLHPTVPYCILLYPLPSRFSRSRVASLRAVDGSMVDAVSCLPCQRLPAPQQTYLAPQAPEQLPTAPPRAGAAGYRPRPYLLPNTEDNTDRQNFIRDPPPRLPRSLLDRSGDRSHLTHKPGVVLRFPLRDRPDRIRSRVSRGMRGY